MRIVSSFNTLNVQNELHEAASASYMNYLTP
jgi:hypothetical protein